MIPYDRFTESVEEYIDSLKNKRAWKRLEQNRNIAEKNGWPIDKLEKYGEWMKVAFYVHNNQREKALAIVKKVAWSITDEDLAMLKDWIGRSRVSKDAWRQKKVSVDTQKNIIYARIAHLIFSIRTNDEVEIGDLIKKGRQHG